jgi:hypothetical protein
MRSFEMYKLIKDHDGVVSVVFQIKTGKCIPLDPANTDYQKYLEWLSEGNTPLLPDEPTE